MDERKATDRVPEFFSRQIRAARRFYLNAAPAAGVPLAVVCGGRESCAANYVIRRPNFPYHSIEFVAKGAGTLTLNQRKFALSAGAVFSYGPGVAQEITTDPDDLLEKYFLDFTGSKAPLLLEQYGLAPGTCARVWALNEVQEAFDILIRDGLQGTGSSNALCAVLVEYLLIKVADLLVPGEARHTPALATFRRCRAHIAAHFRRLKSLERTAEECKIDPAYLCRLFRRFDRQSPYRFLMRLKMNWAAEQLQNPSLMVRQVAAKAGFPDAFHFSHAFKNIFGLSPDAFRRLR